MRASEMLDRVDTFKPNQYTEPQKLGWLLQLDGQIWREIIRTHEGGEDIAQPDGSAGLVPGSAALSWSACAHSAATLGR